MRDGGCLGVPERRQTSHAAPVFGRVEFAVVTAETSLAAEERGGGVCRRSEVRVSRDGHPPDALWGSARRGSRAVRRLLDRRRVDLAVRGADAGPGRGQHLRRVDVDPGGLEHRRRQVALAVGVGESVDPMLADTFGERQQPGGVGPQGGGLRRQVGLGRLGQDAAAGLLSGLEVRIGLQRAGRDHRDPDLARAGRYLRVREVGHAVVAHAGRVLERGLGDVTGRLARRIARGRCRGSRRGPAAGGDQERDARRGGPSRKQPPAATGSGGTS